MDKSLYDIKREYIDEVNAIDEILESGDPEQMATLDERLAQLLTEGHADFKEKGTNYLKVVRQLEAQLASIESFQRDEVERLRKLRTFTESKIKRLKQGLIGAMDLFNFKKYDFGLFRVHTRKGKLKVVVDDLAQVPAEFKGWPEELVIDREAVIAALQAGTTFPGLSLQPAAEPEVLVETVIEHAEGWARERVEAKHPEPTVAELNAFLAQEVPGLHLEQTVSLIVK